MRRLVFNLHRYVALVAGVFVIILGLTGSVMVFEEQIDRLLHPTLSYVTPRGQHLSLEELGSKVSQALGGARVMGYGLASSPDLSDVVTVRGKGGVYVNGYTGEILGTRTGTPLVAIIHQLHLRLLAGKTGARIVSCAGLLLLFLVPSGVYLWWPLKRVKIESGAPWRRVFFDAHNAVGIFSAAFLLILAFTGVMIGFDEVTVPFAYKVTRASPPERSVPSTPQPGVNPITADQAVALALAALPGAKPNFLMLPNGPRRSYYVSMRFPEDLTPGGRSWVVLDQYSGQALLVESSRTAALATRLVIKNRAIHTGDIYGWPGKIFVSLVSLAMVAQAVTGFFLWWKRP